MSLLLNNHNGVITYLEPDILECEVKWALESITTNCTISFIFNGRVISLMAESEEGLESLLMKVKEESEKVGLKPNIQKTKIMASGPITSRQIDGETVETVVDFIFLGSKTIADGECSHEIKRHLLLGRKVMSNLDSILQGRDPGLSLKCDFQNVSFSELQILCLSDQKSMD